MQEVIFFFITKTKPTFSHTKYKLNIFLVVENISRPARRFDEMLLDSVVKCNISRLLFLPAKIIRSNYGNIKQCLEEY
jgi:hypothetical protein